MTDKKSCLVKIVNRNACFLILGLLLCIVAAVLYGVNLSYYSCFVDDEFQSAYAAYDLATKGYTEYTRAYPATWLLSKWITVFGFSEISCRSLSAVYGVIAVASLVFITKEMTNSIGYTAIVSIMFVAEPVLTYYFRFTRLYSLAILLTLWLYFFIYKWLTDKWWYLLPAIPLMLLAYLVNVNSLILMGGVACFIIINAITTRKKLFIVLSFILIGFVAFSVINLSVYHFTGAIPIDFLNFYGNLTGNARVDCAYTQEYASYLLGITFSPKLSLLFLAVIAATCLVDRKIEKPLLYTGLIFMFSVVFMTFFADRYFAEQYIITAVPFAFMTYGYAYEKIRNISKKTAYILRGVLLCLYCVMVGKATATFIRNDNPRDMDYRTAYSKIGGYYDLENETVPIIQSMMRIYGDTIIPHKELAAFDREEDMEIWLNFGHRNPMGIVTVEWLKAPLLTPEAQTVIYNWTNRISGEGIDDTGVNVGYYIFLEPVEYERHETAQSDGTSASDEEAIHVSWDDSQVWIEVDYDLLRQSNETIPETIDMLFMKLCIETDQGENTEAVGLYVPKNSRTASDGKMTSTLVEYVLDSSDLRGMDFHEINNVALMDDMALYGNQMISGVHR